MSTNSTTQSKIINYSNLTINNIFFILLALLPISNFISQNLINGLKLNTNVLLWKEFLVLIVIILMYIRIFFSNKKSFAFTSIYCLLIAFVAFGTLLNKVDTKSILIGFRFELYWVLLLCAGYDWIRSGGIIQLKKQILGIYIGLISVVTLSILSVLIGAEKFYSFLNYKEGVENSDNTINSLFCHSINGLGDGCRLSGGFNNPNHFAAYLVLLIPVVIYFAFIPKKNWFSILNSFLLIILVYITVVNYSRFAYLAILLSLLLILTKLVSHKIAKVMTLILLVIAFGGSMLFFSFPFNASQYSFLPQFITKPGSTDNHYRLTNISIDIIKKNLPNSIYSGYGIGQAGPAAKSEYVKVEDLKIVKENVAIADKYLIFPNSIPISENWYLQLILNGGLIYFLLYLNVISRPLINLNNLNGLSFFIAISLIGIIFGNLFLHLWESSIVSIYFSIFSIMLMYLSQKELDV